MPFELKDKDLISIQQARELIAKAKDAFLEYKNYPQEQVDKIVKAMFEAGYEASERLAKLAVEETGIGKWEDKKLTLDAISSNHFFRRRLFQVAPLFSSRLTLVGLELLSTTYEATSATFKIFSKLKSSV